MRDDQTDQEKLKRLGLRIKKMRKERSFSQEKLADLANVHRTYVGMVERGEKNVTVVSAEKLATALGISISYLFKGYEDGK